MSAAPSCKCVDEVNAKLAEHNGRLSMALGVMGNALIGRLMIATDKVESRKPKRVPVVTAAFCPFCGVKVSP